MNARDILFYGDRTLMGGIRRIPPAERNSPGLIGWWSAREAMAHLASFEQLLAELLERFIVNQGPPELLTRMSPRLNDELVAGKKDSSFDDLLAEYQTAQARVMELIEQISSERLRQVGSIPWYGPEYSLDDFLVYAFYGHKREHTARFDAFADKLEGKDKPLV
jgi:hypothetical protein